MAPEQHEGRVSAQSDLFALGVTVYELLTGKLPFPGPDYHHRKIGEGYAPLPAAAPGFLADLVDDCLKKDPEARPRGMKGFMERLAAAGGKA